MSFENDISEILSGIELPPLDDDAERSVLGCILRNNFELDEVLLRIGVADFYVYAHQIIFEAILDCSRKGNFDTVTVADRLIAAQDKRNKETKQNVDVIKDIGGYPYLAKIWDAAPTVGNVSRYVEIIREKAILRKLFLACKGVLDETEAKIKTADEILEGAERAIYALSESGSAQTILTSAESARSALEELDERVRLFNEGRFPGVRMGLESLERIAGGFYPNELTVIAARPSVGKTAIMLNFLRSACESGTPAFVSSLEQKGYELDLRIWSMISRIDSWRIRRGFMSPEQKEAIMFASQETSGWMKHIDHAPQTVTRICANARRLKRQGKCGILFIDYLQLIESEDRKIIREQQVASMTRRLKLLANELSIPVVLLAQLNREAEASPPKLHHLRESGSIEQDADTVLLLHRVRYGAETHDISVNIAKQRNGPCEEVLLTYHKSHYLFEDIRNGQTTTGEPG